MDMGNSTVENCDRRWIIFCVALLSMLISIRSSCRHDNIREISLSPMKQPAKELRTGKYLARFRPSVKEAGERAAEDQNRTFNSLLETVLVDYLKTNGYLPTEGKSANRRK